MYKFGPKREKSQAGRATHFEISCSSLVRVFLSMSPSQINLISSKIYILLSKGLSHGWMDLLVVFNMDSKTETDFLENMHPLIIVSVQRRVKKEPELGRPALTRPAGPLTVQPQTAATTTDIQE